MDASNELRQMDLSYREAIKASMTMLGKDPLTRICGYGLKVGHEKGFFSGVPASQLCEFTVAEGLMTSAAIGMSLCGLKPLVFLERADFLWNAMDAIVNHLDAVETISNGVFRPTMILRIVVGNKNKPLYTGHTHTQCNAEALKRAVRFPVWVARSSEEILTAYEMAYKNLHLHSTAIYEIKDSY
jgi:pyruvate/2-oxoglutarate/acetoin dehydrogenase E1 component